ncbi:hypothetical protein [Lysinibacillus xylanilyticus]|uniref:hypothetical protein n=1 Tax=Lysinibacillus xylanilyticus TaxID=582475 RepID=UPI003826B9FF
MFDTFNNVLFVLASLWSLWSLYRFFKKGFKILNLDLMGSKPLLETKTVITIMSFGCVTSKASKSLGWYNLSFVIITLTILMVVGLVSIDLLKIKRGILQLK